MSQHPTPSPPAAQAERSYTGSNSAWSALQAVIRKSWAGALGLGLLASIASVCVLSLPITARQVREPGLVALRDAQPSAPLFDHQVRSAPRLPPFWASSAGDQEQIQSAAVDAALRAIADARVVPHTELSGVTPTQAQIADARPSYWLGSDHLGRSLLARVLVGGTISLSIGLAAAALSVLIGTLYGAIAGYAGGVVDAVMMRTVDVLYGLPYVLLVVLLAVAVDGLTARWQVARVRSLSEQTAAFVAESVDRLPVEQRTPQATTEARQAAREKFGTGELSATQSQAINLLTLLIAIGGISWLTMARVIRGQVLSLKAQPFMEAARAIGVPLPRQFFRHLLPNLIGPIVVYATLMVPQAILQESFLSFLGIGVKPPLPSWGNLAADALGELNPVKSHWWLLVFPCLLLGLTLLSLNFVGESVREALDPKLGGRRS